MLVVDGGKLTWPAPPYEPPPAPKQAVAVEEEEEVDPQVAINQKVQSDATALTAVAALTIGVGLASGGDVSNAALFGAFCLASFAGQQAVWGVAPVRSRRPVSETAQIRKRSHPLPSFLETSRIEVKAPTTLRAGVAQSSDGGHERRVRSHSIRWRGVVGPVGSYSTYPSSVSGSLRGRRVGYKYCRRL